MFKKSDGRVRLASLAAGLLATTCIATAADGATVPMDSAFASNPAPYNNAGNTLLGVQDITVARNINGGGTIDSQSFSVVFTGVIGTAGDYHIQGTTGKIVWAGSITNQGNVSVQSGRLVYGQANGTFTQFDTVSAGATIEFNNSGNFTAANNASLNGAGAVLISGSGTTTISGSNLLVTGGVTINAGSTLAMINHSAIGTNIINNGTMVLSNTTYDYVASGSGRLVIADNSSTSMKGNNTYTGGTSIGNNAGLTLLSGGSVVGDITGTATSTLQIARFDAGGTFSNNAVVGTFSQIGTGPITVTSNISATNVVVQNNVLQFGNGTTTGSLTAANISVAFSGSVVFNHSDTVNLSGTLIAGSGTLVQAGTGTLIVKTLPQFATISAGTLELLGGQAASGINNNGVLALSGGSVLSGGAHGSGSLLQMDGTNSLNGNPYIFSGGVTIVGGTLQLVKATLGGNVANNGILDFVDSASTYSDVISGPGQVKFSRVGFAATTILTGDNTYTGGTVVDNALQLGNGGTTGSILGNVTGGTVAVPASLVFNRSNTYTFAGTINGSITVQQSGSGKTILTANNATIGAIVQNGILQLGTGGTSGFVTGPIQISGGTLAINRADMVTFSGSAVLSGAGNLDLMGTGTVLLNGVNPLTGQTNIEAGTLIVGDAGHPGATLSAATGGVLVGSAATLKGYGTIVGGVANSGHVAPGGSIGTLTVGTYAQSATGALDIEIAGAQSDLLNVTGAASLNGTLNLLLTSPSPGAFRIVSAATITGTFSSITAAPGSTPTVFGLRYLPTEVDVVVMPVSAGEAYSDFARNSVDGLLDLHDMAFAHADTRHCHAVADSTAWTGQPECPEFSIWRQINIGGGSADADAGLNALSTRWIGATGGIEYMSDEGISVGVLASYARNVLGLHVSGDSVTTDAFAIGANAGTPLLGGDLEGVLTYGVNDGHARRVVSPSTGSPVIARSDPTSDAVGASVQYSHPLLVDGLAAHARFGYAGLSQDAFTENGAVLFDLHFDEADFSNWYADFGLNYAQAFQLRRGSTLIPSIGVGVSTVLGEADYPLLASMIDVAGAPSFVSTGLPRERTSMTLDLGLTLEGRRGTALYIRASGRANGSERGGLISVGGHFEL